MKADYKNWMPKGMVMGFGCAALVSLVLFLALGISPILPEGSAKRVIGIVFLILTVWRQTENTAGNTSYIKEGRYIRNP